jgi:hypothetical protein
MAQTEGDNNIVEECAAVLNQINEGSQYAENTADQDLNQDQYQYNPGAAGGDVQYNPQFQVDDGNSLQQTPVIDVEDDPVNQYAGEGGAGGTGSQYQYGTQDQTQDATATGPTFSAEQQQYCENVVEQAAAAAVGEEAAAGAVTAGGTAAGAAVGAPGAAGGAAPGAAGGAAAGGAAAGGAAGGGGGGGALPATGGISLLTLGAGALLVGGGLVARRFVR